MKQYKMILVALLGLILTGCYNNFEDPKTDIVYSSDEMFESQNPGLEQISIIRLKETIYGDVDGLGDNGSFEKTKYIRFVADKSECTDKELSLGWYNTGNYYIKGKVISNDEQGHIYKSLHIFDGTAAIELKLTNGLFLDYPCNLETGETMWVYVKLRGLYLGNFRMMLSLGDIPTTSYNSWGDYKYYANSNIVNPIKVRKHVFKGPKDVLNEGTNDSDDILVINSSSSSKLYGKNGMKYLGRLIRFKDLKVCYAGANNEEGETTPVGDNIYHQWLCSAGIPSSIGGARAQVVYKPWYKMAYSVDGVAQYGSVLVTYNNSIPSSTNSTGVYTVRTSGYSRFAGNFIPKDGAVGDVLAIFGLYSKGWTYSYGTYQLSISRFEDFGFKTEPKEDCNGWRELVSWADANFPKYKLVPLTDDAVHTSQVAAWKAQYEANKPADDGSDLWDEWNEWGNWIVWCLENTSKESWLLPQYLTEDEDAE